MDEDGSYIENKQSKKRIPIRRENDMFVVTMVVPKGGTRKIEKQYVI